jgi:hypothetical protein
MLVYICTNSIYLGFNIFLSNFYLLSIAIASIVEILAAVICGCIIFKGRWVLGTFTNYIVKELLVVITGLILIPVRTKYILHYEYNNNNKINQVRVYICNLYNFLQCLHFFYIFYHFFEFSTNFLHFSKLSTNFHHIYSHNFYIYSYNLHHIIYITYILNFQQFFCIF